MNTLTKEQIAKTEAKRQQLKALSDKLKTASQKRKNKEQKSLNQLLLAHYAKTCGTTELKTFAEWQEKGFAVKKGENSYTIWGKPRTHPDTEKVFFPMIHLFDRTQVHTIKNIKTH